MSKLTNPEINGSKLKVRKKGAVLCYICLMTTTKNIAVRVLFKNELAAIYGITIRTLSNYLNVRHYQHLKRFGYRKTSKMLTPYQVAEFVKIMGAPFEIVKENFED